jgi:branched-chain amino acid transport system substrate-binding protein
MDNPGFVKTSHLGAPQETRMKLSKRLLSITISALFVVGTPAFAAKPVLIGVQAPITGQYANEGQGIADAVKLIVKQVNAKGGLLGHRLEVKVCDDQGEAAPAAICARQLTNDGVLAVIGSYTSGAALAAQPVYARANIIQTSDGTSDELTARGYKTFFRNAPQIALKHCSPPVISKRWAISVLLC